MASASKTATMNVDAEKLMAVIRDYAKYPDFVDNLTSAKVLKAGSGSEPTRVAYAVEIMGKKIDYTLDHKEDSATKLSWRLVESSLMKANAGSWELKPLTGGKTEVTYTLELDLNFPVPGFVMKSLVASSLPTMMSSFEKRARSGS